MPAAENTTSHQVKSQPSSALSDQASKAQSLSNNAILEDLWSIAGPWLEIKYQHAWAEEQYTAYLNSNETEYHGAWRLANEDLYGNLHPQTEEEKARKDSKDLAIKLLFDITFDMTSSPETMEKYVKEKGNKVFVQFLRLFDKLSGEATFECIPANPKVLGHDFQNAANTNQQAKQADTKTNDVVDTQETKNQLRQQFPSLRRHDSSGALQSSWEDDWTCLLQDLDNIAQPWRLNSRRYPSQEKKARHLCSEMYYQFQRWSVGCDTVSKEEEHQRIELACKTVDQFTRLGQRSDSQTFRYTPTTGLATDAMTGKKEKEGKEEQGKAEGDHDNVD